MWPITQVLAVLILLTGPPNVQDTAAEVPPAEETLSIQLKFSHRIHLNEVAMACEDCHRGLDEVDLAGPANLPKMADCMVCHQPERSAMAECGRCHPNDLDLRPRNHRNEGFFDDHPELVARLEPTDCAMCHTPNYNPCTQCH